MLALKANITLYGRAREKAPSFASIERLDCANHGTTTAFGSLLNYWYHARHICCTFRTTHLASIHLASTFAHHRWCHHRPRVPRCTSRLTHTAPGWSALAHHAPH